MGENKGRDIAASDGKLGILLPGMGAVATTFVAGVESIRTGLSKPVGSLTQAGTVRLGKRTDNRAPAISDFVPIAGLDDLVFGGWDVFSDNAYEAARKAGVLRSEHLDPLKGFLEGIRPWPAVFDPDYVKKLSGEHVKKGTRRELADQVEADNRRLQEGARSEPDGDGVVPVRPRSTARRRRSIRASRRSRRPWMPTTTTSPRR